MADVNVFTGSLSLCREYLFPTFSKLCRACSGYQEPENSREIYYLITLLLNQPEDKAALGKFIFSFRFFSFLFVHSFFLFSFLFFFHFFYLFLSSLSTSPLSSYLPLSFSPSLPPSLPPCVPPSLPLSVSPSPPSSFSLAGLLSGCQRRKAIGGGRLGALKLKEWTGELRVNQGESLLIG